MENRLGLASLDLLEEIFEPLIDNPFFVKDGGGLYVACNRAMLDLCGLRYRSELIGRTARDIYAAADAARFELDDRAVLAGATIADRVEEVHAARRSPVWLIFSQKPLRDAEGAIVGIVGVSRRMRLDFGSDARFLRFAEALRLVRLGFDQPLSVGKIASKIGVSVSQLERDFRRVLGMTPRAYQQRVRVEEALRLIASALTFSEIAQLSGFGDHSSFTRRFRLLTGLTPTAFRAARGT